MCYNAQHAFEASPLNGILVGTVKPVFTCRVWQRNAEPAKVRDWRFPSQSNTAFDILFNERCGHQDLICCQDRFAVGTFSSDEDDLHYRPINHGFCLSTLVVFLYKDAPSLFQHTNDESEVEWNHGYFISLSVVNIEITTYCFVWSPVSQRFYLEQSYYHH